MRSASQLVGYRRARPAAVAGRGRCRPLLLAALALAACLGQQTPNAAAAERSFIDPGAARFQRLDAERGLSQSSVQAVAQDSERRIWVGTLNGLNRFDGHDTTVFNPRGEGDGEIADNYITALLADTGGRMWIGTLEGISRWEPGEGRFRTFRSSATEPAGLLSNLVISLHRDDSGQLWAGTERGLARWDPLRDRFLHWPAGGRPEAGLPDPRVTAVTSGGDGTLWVGTNAGPARIDIDTGQVLEVQGFPYPGAPVTAIVLDQRGRLFVGLDKRGVVMGDAAGERWHVLPVGDGPNMLGSSLVRAVYVDRAGRLWVGSEDGLDGVVLEQERIVEAVRYRNNRLSSSGLGGGVVAALLEDVDGTLWVGSWNQGIHWLSAENNRFSSYTADSIATIGFRNPASIGFAHYDERLWIGTGSGLYGFDTVAPRLWEVSPGRDLQTYYCGQRVGDALWFGHARGLRILDPATGSYEDRQLPGELSQGRLRRLLVEADRVWAAVDPIGLALLDRSLQSVQSQHPIARSVTFVEPYDERYILVGAYDGLYWFDATTGALRHRHELGPVDEGAAARLPLAPMDFLRDRQGRAWLATNGSGLAEIVFDEQTPASARFRLLDDRHGLADPALKSLELGVEGQLWMSSASGISMYDPAHERFVNFGRGDGTLGRDYINAASARLDDGRLVFGGMDGFTLFDPAQMAGSRAALPPPPLLSWFEADGRSLPLGRGLGLDEAAPELLLAKGGVRSLSIQFASPEFIDTTRLRYRYRVEPFESEWTEVGSGRRLASYTGLGPGSYRFLVQASADRSAWTESRALEFVVPPFWWQTLWARLGLLLVVVMVLASAHRLRLAGIARRNEWLSEQVAERTRELKQRGRALEESKDRAERALEQLETTQQELLRSEKMAALGQLVAGVAHEVNTPLGVALTASSVLREASGRLGAQVTAGQVRRSDFDRFLGTVAESTAMIERNLERAAQLIANFKQVSVDRTSDGRRSFDLGGYLDEVLESLRLMWKRRSISMQVDCPEGIGMDSFPGAIGQVITNLTQNAVVHAFRDEASGHMRVRCRVLDGGQVEIRLTDDGVGMDAQTCERVFDPFFTTRRNEGGTGLGLHIVFNLVTQKLGGRIRVESSPGQGTEFILQLPRKAPD